LTGDADAQVSSQARRAEGAAQNAFGQAKDVVRDINESASLLQKMLMLLTRLIIAMEVKPAYFILSTRLRSAKAV
jgi:hypothetical protein